MVSLILFIICLIWIYQPARDDFSVQFTEKAGFVSGMAGHTGLVHHIEEGVSITIHPYRLYFLKMS